MQNQYIAQAIALFQAAGADPSKITIDIFALYGLFCILPVYAQQKSGVVLLEIEPQATRMAYIYDRQLRFIRTLPKGLFEPAQVVAKQMGITEQEAFEHIIRFGMEPDHGDIYTAPIKQAFANFFNDITFTLQSFTLQAKPVQSIQKIVIFGTSASIKGLPSFVTAVCHIDTEIFALNALLHIPNISIITKVALTQNQCISLACTLPQLPASAFNLRQKEFAPSYKIEILQQLALELFLVLFTLGTLSFNTYWQVHKLNQEAHRSEQEALSSLKEKFKKIPEDITTLSEAIELARNEIRKEERLWSAFSNESRPRFLKYLLELTTKIDRPGVGLEIEKLAIGPDIITIKGQVRGFDELKTLEADLDQSKLFSFVERNSDPKFTKTIRIAKQGQEH